MDARTRGRWASAGSLIAHGAIAALLLAIRTPEGGAAPPAPIAIEIVDIVAPPSAPAVEAPVGAAPLERAAPAPKPGGRHGRPVRAEPTADPLELSVTYDAPLASPLGGAGHGSGEVLFGDGTGAGPFVGGAGGGGLVPIPDVPKPSRARPPRPKHDYARWNYRWPAHYGDARVLVELTIDPRGNVSAVRIVRGFNRLLDERAIEHARQFEFLPALDDAGTPVVGMHRWEFVIDHPPIDFAHELGWR